MGDLQSVLSQALTGVAVGAVAWVGAQLGNWLRHVAGKTAAGRALEQLGVEQAIADAATHYAEEQARKIAGGLAGDAKLKVAVQYAKDHGLDKLAGDGVTKVEQVIESRLSAQRAVDVALNKLGNAAKNLNDALTTGQLAKDLATLNPPKLPPVPTIAGAKP